MIRVIPIPSITGTLSLRKFENELDYLSDVGYKIAAVANGFIFLEKPYEYIPIMQDENDG